MAPGHSQANPQHPPRPSCCPGTHWAVGTTPAWGACTWWEHPNMSSTHGCHACRGVQPGMGQHPWVPCAWRGAPGTGQHPRVLGAWRGAPGMGQHPWVPGGRQGHPARGPERGVGRRWSARGSAGSAGGWERRSSAADYSSAASVACHLFPAASQAGGSSLTGLTRPHSCCHTWAAARAATRGLAPGRRSAGGLGCVPPFSPPPPAGVRGTLHPKYHARPLPRRQGARSSLVASPSCLCWR